MQHRPPCSFHVPSLQRRLSRDTAGSLPCARAQRSLHPQDPLGWFHQSMFRAFSFAAAPSARSTYQSPASLDADDCHRFASNYEDDRAVSPTSDDPISKLPPPPQIPREKTMADIAVDPLSPLPLASSPQPVRTTVAGVPELVERFQDHSISSPHLVAPSTTSFFNCSPFPAYDDSAYNNYSGGGSTSYEYDEALGMDDDEPDNADDYHVPHPFDFQHGMPSYYSTAPSARHHLQRPTSSGSDDFLLPPQHSFPPPLVSSEPNHQQDDEFIHPPAASLRQRRQALHYDAAQLRDISVLIRQMIEAGDQCAICSPTPSAGSSGYASSDGGEDASGVVTAGASPMLYPPPIPCSSTRSSLYGLRYRRSAECVNPQRRVVKQVRQRKNKVGARRR